MIPSEQRHGYPREAVVVGEAVVIEMAVPEHFVDADISGQAPEIAIAMTICFRTEMPPYSAADGLLPVARSS
jgi:hypothetical protein